MSASIAETSPPSAGHADGVRATKLGMPTWWSELAASSSDQNSLLNFMSYFWWLVLGGAGQILFGGMYLGSKQAAQINHISTPQLQLVYVLTGLLMIEMALGILQLRWWVYWAGFLLTLLLLVVAVTEIVRWITGTPITVEVGIFAILDILFALYNVFLLLSPGVRTTLRYAAPLRGHQVAADLVLFTVIIAVPSLCASILVNYVDHHLSDQVLALVYVGGGALLIFMAYAALRVQTWIWAVTWGWVALLLGLSTYVIVHKISGTGSVEGVIASVFCILFAASVIYYLLLSEVRSAFIHKWVRNPLFNPLFLLTGLALTVFVVVIYLFPGLFGTQAIACSVAGLAIGVVVGAIPNTDPITKVMGFVMGLLLAEVSYVVRGGFLPYTRGSSAVVVALLLLVITGITALFRSAAWFVSMLLGAGTLYALVELQFQTVPSAYLATSGLALVSVFLGFGLGYFVSVLLGLTMSTDSAAAATDAGPASSNGPSSSTSDGATAPVTTGQPQSADKGPPTPAHGPS